MAAEWVDPHRGEMIVEMSMEGTVAFFFDGVQEPFTMDDFKVGSATWLSMYQMEMALIDLREKWDEGNPISGV
jgi:hypothetical protein